VRKGTCESLTSSVYVYSMFYPLPIVSDYETRFDTLNDGSENIDLTTYNSNITQNLQTILSLYYTCSGTKSICTR
jgi:hypothetical protein